MAETGSTPVTTFNLRPQAHKITLVEYAVKKELFVLRCAWCKKIKSYEPANPWSGVSHGICRKCKSDMEWAEYDAWENRRSMPTSRESIGGFYPTYNEPFKPKAVQTFTVYNQINRSA